MDLGILRLFALSSVLCSLGAGAAVVTDGSLGPAQTLQGPNYAVPDDLGARQGANLFHSFAQFSIQTGESAVFSGPAGLERVISRVSGGGPSEFDGLLRSEIPGADFYFINPAGVFFGPDAVVDVPASFFVAAADHLEFSDRTLFSAHPDDLGSRLTLAAPAAFGFLGGAGMTEVQGSEIQLGAGQTLMLAGPGIRITDAALTIQAGELSLAAAGEAAVRVPLDDHRNGTGRLAIEGSALSVSGDGGGSIQITGGALEWRNSRIENHNTGARSAAGGARITAQSLGAFDTQLTQDALAAGDAPWLRLTALERLVLDENSLAGGNAYGAGTAPTVEVHAGELVIRPGASVASGSYGAGDAGAVSVQAESIRIDQTGFSEGAGITSRAYAGEGQSGAVAVEAAGLIELLGGAKISSSSYAAGDAGPVQVHAGAVRIDGGDATPVSGITSQANRGSSGAAGDIDLVVDGRLEILNGGFVSSSTWAAGDGGRVAVQAGELEIRGNGDRKGTGIISHAAEGSTGDAGAITVAVSEQVEISDGGLISSRTDAAGHGGAVSVSAGSLSIRRGEALSGSGINSQAYVGSTGSAGAVRVMVGGALEILQGGAIASSSLGSGDAGTVEVTAGELLADGAGAVQGSGTGIASRAWRPEGGQAGDVSVQVDGAIRLFEGGGIGSETGAAGDGGRIEVSGGSLLIDHRGSRFTTGISSAALADAGGAAGEIHLTFSGPVEVLNGGVISSSSYNDRAAGRVEVRAGSLRIDGAGSALEEATGIFTEARGSAGAGGDVRIDTPAGLEISNRGMISTSAYGQGAGGALSVDAGALSIIGDGGDQLTGLLSRAAAGSAGDAGRVAVAVGGMVDLQRGGLISSRTEGAGNAGAVSVQSGSLRIDRGDSAAGTGVNSQAYIGSGGNAGEVTVQVAGDLEILRAGAISSSTLGEGDAGSVAVQAGDIRIDGRGATEGSGTGIASRSWGQAQGQAGEVRVTTPGAITLAAGGGIGSDTGSSGDAGSIFVSAGELRIDGRGSALPTGISSAAMRGATGAGGQIEVVAPGVAEIRSGGLISSSTFGPADGGRVEMNVGTLNVHDGQGVFTGVASRSAEGAAGGPGTVLIQAEDLMLSEGGRISIAAEGGAATNGSSQGAIQINAQRIQLDSGAAIDAHGRGLSPAADIRVHADESLAVRNTASITTAAEDASAGAIQISSPGAVRLQQGLVTTSVSGLLGDGGPIRLDTGALVLDGGFVQANTAAPSGRGGDIRIHADVIVTAREQPLRLGGEQRQGFDLQGGFSVIQAAAPQGISGDVDVTAPQIDVAASVGAVSADFTARPAIDDSRCRVSPGNPPSSLEWHGLAVSIGSRPSRRCGLRATAK